MRRFRNAEVSKWCRLAEVPTCGGADATCRHAELRTCQVAEVLSCGVAGRGCTAELCISRAELHGRQVTEYPMVRCIIATICAPIPAKTPHRIPLSEKGKEL